MSNGEELAREAVKAAASIFRTLKRAENAFDTVSGEQLVTDEELGKIAVDLSAGMDIMADSLGEWDELNHA